MQAVAAHFFATCQALKPSEEQCPCFLHNDVCACTWYILCTHLPLSAELQICSHVGSSVLLSLEVLSCSCIAHLAELIGVTDSGKYLKRVHRCSAALKIAMSLHATSMCR